MWEIFTGTHILQHIPTTSLRDLVLQGLVAGKGIKRILGIFGRSDGIVKKKPGSEGIKLSDSSYFVVSVAMCLKVNNQAYNLIDRKFWTFHYYH